MIDLDRLHSVHFGRSSRGCGKTTLFCANLIGIAQIEVYKYQRITILFNWMKDAHHVMMILRRTCEGMSQGYTITSNSEININDTIFKFTRNCIENRHGYNTIENESEY